MNIGKTWQLLLIELGNGVIKYVCYALFRCHIDQGHRRLYPIRALGREHDVVIWELAALPQCSSGRKA
jgi:hypothetical protein